MRSRLNNQEGFTLVEIIAVLILLGILAAVAVPRYIDLTGNAEQQAILSVVAELNGRENMAWANVKLSTNGYDAATSDDAIWPIVGATLGNDFTWSTAASATGGAVTFKGTAYPMTRTASTTTAPGSWVLQ